MEQHEFDEFVKDMREVAKTAKHNHLSALDEVEWDGCPACRVRKVLGVTEWGL